MASKHGAPAQGEGQRMASTFFEYERDHNIFLNALRQNGDLLAIVNYILDKETAALLVPHSAILEGETISAPFVRAHTIVLNPENPKQFLTLNGLFGAFVKVAVSIDEEEQRYVHVLQPDPPPAETLNPLVDVPTYFNSVRGCFESAHSVRSIPVLREGDISLRGKTVVIFVISEPLVSVSDPEPKPVILSVTSSTSLPRVLSSDTLPPPLPFEPIFKPAAPVQLKDLLVNNVNTGLFPESPAPEPRTKQLPPKDPFLTRLHQAPALQKNLKAFTASFMSKRHASVEEQRDQFRAFVQAFENAMANNALWKSITAEEGDAASEALERLLTAKLYSKIFESLVNEKDKTLHARIQQLHFLKPHHLDIPITDLEQSPQFELAKSELAKINSYKAPKDKLVCIFNCCKVVYKLLKKSDSNPAGADDFLPLLIFITLKANPVNLHANMLYISHFRAPDKMNTEAGYYYTHLFSAITFIEILDAKSISIDPAEFDHLLHLPAEKKPFTNTAALTVLQNGNPASAISTSPSALGYAPLSVTMPPPPAGPPASDLISFDSLQPLGSPSVAATQSTPSSTSTPLTHPHPSVPSIPSITSISPSPSPAPSRTISPARSMNIASPTPSNAASLIASVSSSPAASILNPVSGPVVRTSFITSPPGSPSAVDFATASQADLMMEHIPLLLDAYKQLLNENKCLRLLLQENGITYQ